MNFMTLSLSRSNRVYRIAVSGLFFLQGLTFATWASRIPSIQEGLRLSEAALGLVLFALPAGSLISLPLAGWLVSRYGSKRISINALLLYSLLLFTIGLAPTVGTLCLVLFLFGFAGNTANIAINTQAVGVEGLYGRAIMASFHGLWSLAGFAAASIGGVAIGRGFLPGEHFGIVTGSIVLGMAFLFQFLLPDSGSAGAKTPLFARPDRSLLKLGAVAFCCMICEGTMFDWSGIYFKKIVEAPAERVAYGFTAFMLTMASGRFGADWLTNRLGLKRTLILSGALIAAGLLLAVLLPFEATAIGGFLLVGLGVSSVVPLVYSEAGRSPSMPPGPALAAVSSIGFLGFLFGPPLIGLIAGATSLRFSFGAVALLGLAIVFLSFKLNNHVPLRTTDTTAPQE